jgi:hypothetical protein
VGRRRGIVSQGVDGGRAIDLDRPEIDWVEIAELVDASYRQVAPPRLIAQLEGRRP